MNFHVTCELEYSLQDPAVFLFALQCIETEGQVILRENLTVEPSIPTEELNLCGGMNRFTRINTLLPGPLNVFYEADVRVSPFVVPVSSLEIGDLGDLSAEALPLILPSRYCSSDRLRQMANELFGHLTTPHAIATAVSDWIYENIAYVSGSSGENCSALDTLNRQQGVCRDFAHLGITFCRALNIPARYTSCYAYQLQPQDFHACFEVLLGGAWYLFDATRLVPLNGLIRIATGRDAADAAVCTIFGSPELVRSFVTCECGEPDFTPLTRDCLVENDEVLCLP
jgi:transglutaminase-like putative cysteine protease